MGRGRASARGWRWRFWGRRRRDALVLQTGRHGRSCLGRRRIGVFQIKHGLAGLHGGIEGGIARPSRRRLHSFSAQAGVEGFVVRRGAARARWSAVVYSELPQATLHRRREGGVMPRSARTGMSAGPLRVAGRWGQALRARAQAGAAPQQRGDEQRAGAPGVRWHGHSGVLLWSCSPQRVATRHVAGLPPFAKDRRNPANPPLAAASSCALAAVWPGRAGTAMG